MKWAPLTLLGGLCTVANGEVQSDIFTKAKISVGNFVDSEACYSAIEYSVSDKDGDQRMDQEAYVDFVEAYGPDDFLEDYTTFEELPLILKSNFYVLACLCENKTDAEDQCCVGSKAGIETDGAISGETPTDAEQSYLFLVCSQTSTSIDRVIQSMTPTGVPIVTPEPSALPSPAPIDDESLPPTRTPVDDSTIQEEVVVTYRIGIKDNGVVFEDYDEELISAMDSLAPTVLLDVRRRQLRVGRRLQSVFLPTSIKDHTVIGKCAVPIFYC